MPWAVPPQQFSVALNTHIYELTGSARGAGLAGTKYLDKPPNRQRSQLKCGQNQHVAELHLQPFICGYMRRTSLHPFSQSLQAAVNEELSSSRGI